MSKANEKWTESLPLLAAFSVVFGCVSADVCEFK